MGRAAIDGGRFVTALVYAVMFCGVTDGLALLGSGYNGLHL